MKRLGDAVRAQKIVRTSALSGNTGAGAECPVCKGAGWLRADVPVGDPFFGRAIMCDCLMTKLESQRADDRKYLSSLEGFRDKTFENFDPKLPGVSDAWDAARRFARDPMGWLVLLGGYGCGKTHLAAAIANEATKTSRSQVLFAVVPDLLDHLRAAFAPTSSVQYDELFEGVRTTQLLVLDDLGTESGTPWAREKLYQIFNYRYNHEYPTVVTSNRSLDDVDERIRSRLCDQVLSRIVEIDAGDYRVLKPGQRRLRAHRAG